jgi:hypothetical protein
MNSVEQHSIKNNNTKILLYEIDPTIQRTSGQCSIQNANQLNIAEQLLQPQNVVTTEA